ncbi:hypothetical protein [Streptomyces sp. NPDC006012]|uniref:hypothetical protein n=1 Tax=Streptomyces sp. NPDC006012 TaxID=3364739 RepID=UPI0036B178DD
MVVLVSARVAELVGAYADATAVLTLLIGGCGTATKYRNHGNHGNHGNRSCPTVPFQDHDATAMTVSDRSL